MAKFEDNVLGDANIKKDYFVNNLDIGYIVGLLKNTNDDLNLHIKDIHEKLIPKIAQEKLPQIIQEKPPHQVIVNPIYQEPRYTITPTETTNILTNERIHPEDNCPYSGVKTPQSCEKVASTNLSPDFKVARNPENIYHQYNQPEPPTQDNSRVIIRSQSMEKQVPQTNYFKIETQKNSSNHQHVSQANYIKTETSRSNGHHPVSQTNYVKTEPTPKSNSHPVTQRNDMKVETPKRTSHHHIEEQQSESNQGFKQIHHLGKPVRIVSNHANLPPLPQSNKQETKNLDKYIKNFENDFDEVQSVNSAFNLHPYTPTIHSSEKNINVLTYDPKNDLKESNTDYIIIGNPQNLSFGASQIKLQQSTASVGNDCVNNSMGIGFDSHDPNYQNIIPNNLELIELGNNDNKQRISQTSNQSHPLGIYNMNQQFTPETNRTDNIQYEQINYVKVPQQHTDELEGNFVKHQQSSKHVLPNQNPSKDIYLQNNQQMFLSNQISEPKIITHQQPQTCYQNNIVHNNSFGYQSLPCNTEENAHHHIRNQQQVTEVPTTAHQQLPIEIIHTSKNPTHKPGSQSTHVHNIKPPSLKPLDLNDINTLHGSIYKSDSMRNCDSQC